MRSLHYLFIKDLRSFVSHLVHNPVLVAAVVIVAILTLAWPAASPVLGAAGDGQILVALDPAAGRPTVTPADQAGPPPTPTNTPTPVPVENCAPWSVAAPAEWSLVMCDTFDDNSSGWIIEPTTGELGDATRTVADGGYTWEVKAYSPFVESSDVPLDPVTDFYAAVDTHLASGPEGDTQYGLQFRLQDTKNYYMFLVSDDRDFKLFHFNEGQWTTLIDWTTTEAFLANDWNRVGVKAVGPDFTFYVNDQEVAQFSDATIPQGKLRVAFQLVQPDSTAVVDFDNFEVRLPSTGAEMPPAPPTPAAAPATTAPATPTPLPPPPTEMPAVNTPVPPPADTPPPAPPEQTPEVPAPTEAAPVAVDTLPAAPTDWPVVFSETFDDNSNKWVVGEDFSKLLEATKLVNETFTWQYKALQGVYSTVEVPYPEVSDFYASVDVKRYTGPEDAYYGLTFRRVNPANFYLFLVNEEGEFQLQAQAKGRWYQLVEPTHVEAVQPGEWNRLAVKGEGPQLTFYINDQQVLDLEDIRFRKGTLGLNLLVAQGDAGILEFDNFELRVPEGS
jgi:hypothetical protein